VAPFKADQHADPPSWTGLLRARRKRPNDSRAAEERDEIAPPHGLPLKLRAIPYHIVGRKPLRALRQNWLSMAGLGLGCVKTLWRAIATA
jgi:hypothetical protein